MTTAPEQPLALPAALRLIRRGEFPGKLGLCQRLFGRSLAAHGVCWVQTAYGPVWKLDLANPTHRWIVYGYYEGPSFWRWFRAHRANIATIVDSGANIGQTVLYFSALTPAARIFAYEPGGAARAWLTESLAACGAKSVVVESTGLSATASSARLASEGPSSLRGSWNKVNMTTGEAIVLATLDDELARHRITTLDLWKLDMEGHELQALRGAKRALSAGRVRAVYVEAAGEAGRGSIDFLTGLGYSAHGIARTGRLTAWQQTDRFENALCLAPGENALRG